MVVFFTDKDLVDFGTYLLSTDRKQTVLGKSHSVVYQEDLQNWIAIQREKQIKEQESEQSKLDK
jgi:hypothetical protein